MSITRKIKLLIVITTNLLFVSCVPNKENFNLVIFENNKPVDNFTPTHNKPIIVEDSRIRKNIAKDEKDIQNIIKDKDLINPSASKRLDFTNVTESKNTTSLKPKVKEKIVPANSTPSNDRKDTIDPEKEVIVSADPVKNKIKNDPEIPNDNKPEIIQPTTKEDPPNNDETELLCENAWFDESKPCDYIPDNLKPVDELGRSVPHFYTSKEAWDWGELQIEDENSEYGCRGFSRMDGYQNNGRQFFFAYLKVCDIN